MASRLLLRQRMSIRRVVLSSIVLTSACAGLDFEPGSVRGDVHASLAPQRPPTLKSELLDYKLHSPIERSNVRALISGPRRINQKVLLLTADDAQPSYLAARDALVRMGVPFQALNATAQEVTDALLTDSQSTCNFSAVLFATSGLGYNDPNVGWTSALSVDEWSRIASFEVACSAREAVWYAWPSPDLGLTFVGSFDWSQTVPAVIANPGFFNRVPADAQLSYQNAAGYRAAPVDATTTPILTDGDGNVLVATHTRPDGSEVLVSTVDSNPYLAHALALEFDMVRWLTRGLFVGKKRTYLSAQIDDLFLSNDMWRLDLHANPEDDTHTFRISGADLTKAAAWQTAMQSRLPAGSSFYTTMAYNGVGTTSSYSTDKTLANAAKALGAKFHWMSHTWDHENMDVMTRGKARTEVNQNCSKGQNMNLFGLACDELVTPDMSGLATLTAVRGMLDAGVRSVVSDTSHAASDPRFASNPGDNPSFNVGRVSTLDSRLYQIPRHPTNVFYDVKDPTDLVDSYNVRFPGDKSYPEILDLNSSYPLLYLLQGDVDPLMFHQANLASYDAAGHSLYGDFVEAVMAKYLSISKAPVITLSQRAIGEAMKQRAQLETCNARAVIVESSGTRSLEVSSTAACTIPVTGVSNATLGKVESYAGDATTSITMPAGGGTVTIPL